MSRRGQFYAKRTRRTVLANFRTVGYQDSQQNVHNFEDRSGEYIETFGHDTVPYFRAFKSEARAYCSTFVGMAEVTPANASSDNSLAKGSLLVRSLNQSRGSGTTVQRYMPQQGVFDNTPFSYSQATRNSSSATSCTKYH